MGVRTIILDFGNVVGFFDHGRTVASLVPFTALSNREIYRQIYGGPLEQDYDRGRLTTEYFVAQAMKSAQLSCETSHFASSFIDIFTPNPDVCSIIPVLSRNFRLILASNTNELHFQQIESQFSDLLREFDFLALSFQAGCRKPEVEFYRYCQEHAAVPPEECLFVDDLSVNVDAARSFGWQASLYTSTTSFVNLLATHGINVN